MNTPELEHIKLLTERIHYLESALEAARREVALLQCKVDVYRARSNEPMERRTT